MITENYVGFETAKLLKEKGFDEPCYAYWHEDENRLIISQSMHAIQNITNPCFFGLAAPTLQMTMKWLREMHHIHISIEMGFDVDNSQYFFYIPSVCRFSNKSGEYQTPFGEKEFGSYENAAEVTIKYCLENLI